MARPREFDVDTVLNRATEAFWATGYDSTSMADLMDAMGLQKGSIYKAFGDKRALFRTVMERYVDALLAAQKAWLSEEKPASEAIRDWLEGSARWAHDDGDCKGCLAMNTVVERDRDNEEIRAMLLGHLRTVIALLEDCIRRGQRAGEFRTDLDPTALAYVIQSQVFGMIAMIRASRGRVDVRPIIDSVLKLLS